LRAGERYSLCRRLAPEGRVELDRDLDFLVALGGPTGLSKQESEIEVRVRILLVRRDRLPIEDDRAGGVPDLRTEDREVVGRGLELGVDRQGEPVLVLRCAVVCRVLLDESAVVEAVLAPRVEA